jgi:hypothetical protein
MAVVSQMVVEDLHALNDDVVIWAEYSSRIDEAFS